MSDVPTDDLEEAVRTMYAGAADQARTAPPPDESTAFGTSPSITTTVGTIRPTDSPVAVRSAGAIADRQLVLHGEHVDVVVDLAASGDGQVDVRGTVIGDEVTYAVQLVVGDDEQALTVTDEDGSFELCDVDVGSYLLVVAGRRSELATVLEVG